MKRDSPIDSFSDYLRIAKDYHRAYSGDAAMLIDYYARRVHSTPGFSTVYYLLDYTTGKYVFLGHGVQAISGYNTAYVMEGGVDFFSKRYETADYRLLTHHIFRENRLFLQQYPAEQHGDFMFSYNLRFRNKRGELVSVLQHHTTIKSTAAGTPLLSLGFIYPASSLINETKMLYAINHVGKPDGLTGCRPLVQKCFFHRSEDSLLTRREIEVLKWISDGLSSKQIAVKMHLSVHTINNHRKNMTQKTNSGSVGELLKYAILNGLM